MVLATITAAMVADVETMVVAMAAIMVAGIMATEIAADVAVVPVAAIMATQMRSWSSTPIMVAAAFL